MNDCLSVQFADNMYGDIHFGSLCVECDADFKQLSCTVRTVATLHIRELDVPLFHNFHLHNLTLQSIFSLVDVIG